MTLLTFLLQVLFVVPLLEQLVPERALLDLNQLEDFVQIKLIAQRGPLQRKHSRVLDDRQLHRTQLRNERYRALPRQRTVLFPRLRSLDKLRDVGQRDSFLHRRQLRLVNTTRGRRRRRLVDDHDLGVVPRKRRPNNIEVRSVERGAGGTWVRTMLHRLLRRARLLVLLLRLLRRPGMRAVAVAVRDIRRSCNLARWALDDGRPLRHTSGGRELAI